MGTILHLAERARWRAALPEGPYTPAAYAHEGFVHCSEPEQLEAVANRLFLGRDDLVLLAIDEDRLAAEVRREDLYGGGELFPHVYGPIEVEAVIAVREVGPGEDGRFDLSQWSP